MPQDLFNSCAILAARCYEAEEIDEGQVVGELVAGYQQSYKDDVRLAHDIDEAAKKVIDVAKAAFPEEKSLSGVFTQLLFLSQNYQTSGKKRRKKLLGGTLFNKEKRYNEKRVQACVAAVVLYHVGTVSGKFPIKGA